MLNFFFMYSIIWGVILLFYSLGWSDLCEDLHPSLKFFFFITISVSLVLGIIYRKHFKYKESSFLPQRNKWIPWIIVGFNILEFIYCRQIPFVNILFGGGTYEGHEGYTGIPTLHSIFIAFGSFYAQYLFYRFLCNKKEKNVLRDYFIILISIYLLQFNRGGLMISFFMSVLLYLAKNTDKIKSGINKKTIISGVAFLLFVCWGFGVLGNIRHGYLFNDSSYIERVGRFNEKYPTWLPKQFMWPYSYIVTPVANINYNVSHSTYESNTIGFVMSFVPDFLERRIYSGKINSPELVEKYIFNATPGFGTAYVNAGIKGMYILYFVLLFGNMMCFKLLPIKYNYRMTCLAIMNIIVIFQFFTNTLFYSAISFQVIFPLLSFFKLKWQYSKKCAETQFIQTNCLYNQ